MNRSMDDLLRETLRARAADSTAGCVDAETAAAFVDGTLAARARASAEAHIADCPRCQAVLAALVKSTPPPMERAWWRRPALAWLVPATVAVAGVAIWINVPDHATLPVAQTPRDLALPIESVPVPQQPTAASAASQVPRRGEPLKDARAVAPEVPRARQADAVAKAESPDAMPDVSTRGLEARQDKEYSVARSAPVPSPAASPRAAALAESVTVLTPARGTIVSSDRASQWRIGAGGDVQHSADGGASWQTQAIGAGLTPLAGSSPAASVCWLVGRAGIVLLTTDTGKSWTRLPFPSAIDLASVGATDDRTATVVSVDGRTFMTSDSGTSWRQ